MTADVSAQSALSRYVLTEALDRWHELRADTAAIQWGGVIHEAVCDVLGDHAPTVAIAELESALVEALRS